MRDGGARSPSGASGFVREQRRAVALSLAFSAGLHFVFLGTLALSPGAWRHGLNPAFAAVPRTPPPQTVTLEFLPPESRTGASGGAGGIPAGAKQAGSRVPIPERYFRSSEVDVPAQTIARAPLIYPEGPYGWRLAGEVKARVYIGETGAVESVQVVEASPPGHFEQAAIDALRQVAYRPAQIRGRAVKSQKLVVVVFDPYEGNEAGRPARR